MPSLLTFPSALFVLYGQWSLRLVFALEHLKCMTKNYLFVFINFNWIGPFCGERLHSGLQIIHSWISIESHIKRIELETTVDNVY